MSFFPFLSFLPFVSFLVLFFPLVPNNRPFHPLSLNHCLKCCEALLLLLVLVLVWVSCFLRRLALARPLMSLHVGAPNESPYESCL